MDKDQESRGKFFIVLGIVMAVVSFLIVVMIFIFDILPEACFFLEFITVTFVINGIAYFVFFIIAADKDGDHTIILSLVCLVIAIVSAIIGVISFVNDHSFILRGVDAQLIWFFVSIPAFILAIIHFIVSYIRMRKRLNDLEK